MVTQIESSTTILADAERERVIESFFEGLGKDAVLNAMNSGKEWKLRPQTDAQAKIGERVVDLYYDDNPTPISMAMNEHWDHSAPRIKALHDDRVVGRGTIGLVMPYVEKYLQNL